MFSGSTPEISKLIELTLGHLRHHLTKPGEDVFSGDLFFIAIANLVAKDLFFITIANLVAKDLFFIAIANLVAKESYHRDNWLVAAKRS